jgi:hypothetical protein
MDLAATIDGETTLGLPRRLNNLSYTTRAARWTITGIYH